jgi:hypothetical protein
MPGFILEFTTKANGLVVLEGDNVKYWASTGLPTYEGGTEGFIELFPEVVAEMVKRGVISHVK